MCIILYRVCVVFFVQFMYALKQDFCICLIQARRSMRFAKHLRDIGDNFRHLHLDSDDTRDRTLLFEDWRKMEVSFEYCSDCMKPVIAVFTYVCTYMHTYVHKSIYVAC